MAFKVHRIAILSFIFLLQFSYSQLSDLQEQLVQSMYGEPLTKSRTDVTTKAIVTPKEELLSSSLSNSGSIDLIGEEDNYIIGPGDQFTAHIWTSKEEKTTFSVNSTGKVSIPAVGTYDLHNLTFRQAQDSIIAVVSKKYKRAKIDVSLSKAKMISVSVYGAVMTPGVYTIDGTRRISEVIRLAGGLRREANPREVTVDNTSGPSRTVDLYKDYRIKDVRSPFVNSGDKIYVKNREKIITISGAVNYPETYDFLAGETLSELIEVSGGFTRGVDSSRILITRFINEEDSIVRFELSHEVASTFILQEDDYIFVPNKKDYRITRQVTISGEVMFPGKYAVREDKTRLIDLIGLAGGITDEAYLPGSHIDRLEFTDAGNAEYKRLQTMNPMDLSPDEKSYLKYRNSSTNGRVSINFDELMNDNKEIYNIILRGGDEIYVARRGLSVNVMGAVINPGLIDYKEGEDLSYYIKQTGGYQDDAEKRRVKIIKGGSTMWLKPKHVENIEVGDAIWVPEKPYRDRLKSTKEVLAITGSIAALVLATISVLNYIDDK